MSKIILGATASRDLFPGHHDPEFARAQGQQTVYANTAAIEGLIDRVVCDWAGPDAWIARRTLRMGGSLYAGSAVAGSGAVTASWVNSEGTRLATVDVQLSNDSGVQASGTVVVAWLGAQSQERFPIDVSGAESAR